MIDLQKIALAFGRAKQIPQGYLCQCPCHDDKEASLSIKLTKDGGLAVNCFAGCDWKIIFDEIKGRDLLPKNNAVKDKIEIIYSYTDENGKELFQKVRFANRKGIHRHWSNCTSKTNAPGWEWNIQGIRNVLYNLPAVLKSDVVYLCEGEKDADSLNSHGLVATTNNAGALTWLDIFTETLKDKKIIICQDNDEAGKKRSAKLITKLSEVAQEVRLFIPPGVPDHGDVTDWLQLGNEVSQILTLSTPIQKKVNKSQEATRDQFYELFDSVLNSPRKCIFAEKLMSFDSVNNLWNPAINSLSMVRSEAIVASQTTAIKYNSTHLEPHFFAYEHSKPPEFLIDIPKWDGEDRISQMAYFIKLKPDSGVSDAHFSELLKEWMAKLFLRLYNPKIQNQIMVLQGHQGAGKDTWIEMLTDGLGQFSVPFTVAKDDKDMYLKIHRGLVMKISEFDRTAKTEVSTLKDIITTPSTDIRAPYDRDSKIRSARCSFISSANIENILRDYTGNRRFLIFEIESIEYAYRHWSDEEKKHWQMQCLAEALELARVNYKAGDESKAAMRQYIEKKTPDDPADDTLREYAEILRMNVIKYAGAEELTDSELLDVTQQIKQRTGLNVRAIREQLRRRVGKLKTVGLKRVWFYRTEFEH